MISSQVSNPFVLLMNPEEVIRAVESSERLRRLRRHVCRPLDRPAAAAADLRHAALGLLRLDGADPGDR